MYVKQIFLVLIFLITPITAVFSQKLAENYIDDFTGDKILRTSWEKLIYNNKTVTYFRLVKINDFRFVQLKIMYGNFNRRVFSINKQQESMIKFTNGEIAKLFCTDYTITCTGCGAIGINGSGAQGIKVSYILNNIEYEKFTDRIEKIRIYTSIGLIDNEIKPKHSKLFINALKLIE